jgi:lysophospholipase L1-like esterase
MLVSMKWCKRARLKPPEMLNLLALGDSYSIGEAVPGPARWPNQLVRALRRRHLPVRRARIIAKTGWTTAELAAAIDRCAPRGPYALVSLLIGVNNQYRGLQLADYQRELAALIVHAQQLAGAHGGVLMVSIPDWGTTPFARASGRDCAAIASEIDHFNAAAAELAQAAKVAFVDITAISRQPQAALTEDGLHPAGAQYRRWVDAILPHAEPIVRRAFQHLRLSK